MSEKNEEYQKGYRDGFREFAKKEIEETYGDKQEERIEKEEEKIRKRQIQLTVGVIAITAVILFVYGVFSVICWISGIAIGVYIGVKEIDKSL